MKQRREPASETTPNLAPMVDVIMVLLVFFLLGATMSLLNEGILQTELDPRSGPGEGVAIAINPLIRIALFDENDGGNAGIRVMQIDLPPGDFGALHQYLAERKEAGADPANPVVIAAEQTVRWKYVIRAMDAAVTAGFQNVQFAVSLAPTAPDGEA